MEFLESLRVDIASEKKNYFGNIDIDLLYGDFVPSCFVCLSYCLTPLNLVKHTISILSRPYAQFRLPSVPLSTPRIFFNISNHNSLLWMIWGIPYTRVCIVFSCLLIHQIVSLMIFAAGLNRRHCHWVHSNADGDDLDDPRFQRSM